MPISVRRYVPGTELTGRATGAPVAGARFVKAAGPQVDGGNIPITHAGASDGTLGLTERDAATGKVTRVFTDGSVAQVTASGPVTAGQDVQGAADGKVAVLSSGRKRGHALETAAADGDLIFIQVQL